MNPDPFEVSMRTVMLVLAILVVPLTGIPADIQAAPAAPTQACRIVEGSALGAVRLGMPVEEAFSLVGKPVGYVLRSPESVYLLPGEAIQITAVDEKVTRLASRDPLCITGKGVKIGDSEGRVTEAYAQSVGSFAPRPDPLSVLFTCSTASASSSRKDVSL